MTRKDYMEHRITFEEYYTSVAQVASISFDRSDMLEQIIKALANGDEHLNTIKLHRWDAMAIGAKSAISASLKQHEDFFSLAAGVCTMKQAAKNACKPTYRQYENEHEQWLEWLKQALVLPIEDLKRHASVSTDNRHECKNCFCCAALMVLRMQRSVTHA